MYQCLYFSLYVYSVQSDSGVKNTCETGTYLSVKPTQYRSDNVANIRR